jgi:hypothetical protein
LNWKNFEGKERFDRKVEVIEDLRFKGSKMAFPKCRNKGNIGAKQHGE